MKPFRITLLALLLLSACGGNPFLAEEDTDDTTTETTDDTGGITTDGGIPPGTANPTPRTGIKRFEQNVDDNSAAEPGDGFARTFTYNSEDDSFIIDNLGFDGNNVFARIQPEDLNPEYVGNFAIYDSAVTYNDSETGTPIRQFEHRAIYGVSADGSVSFAIVRTGSYVDYGFGGFVYQRTGGVTLPAEGLGAGEPANPAYRGQAHYEGTASGLRDFVGLDKVNNDGLEMTTADMSVDIDYDDFNDGNAVKGVVYNRRIYDLSGADITQDSVDALTADSGISQTRIPNLIFSVGPGVMNDNGEIVGELGSTYGDSSGSSQDLDEGKYYALVSGSGTNQQIVGVYVVTADDKRYDGVTARETSGFILARK